MLTVVCVCVCRRKAVPLWLGGMWLEVCPFGRAHEALQEAHGTSAISVPKMRQSLLSVRPPCTAHETTSITKTGRPPIKWLVNHVLPLNKSQRNSMTSCVVHSIRVGTCLFFCFVFFPFCRCLPTCWWPCPFPAHWDNTGMCIYLPTKLGDAKCQTKDWKYMNIRDTWKH